MKKLYFIFGFALLINLGLFSKQTYCQSFNNFQQVAIQDNRSVAYPITVAGIASQIDTVQFGLQSVSFDIEHEDNSQLTISLESPSGKSIILLRRLPGINYSGTEINGTSAKYIDFGENSYTENYRSIQDLGLLNNLSDPNGIWNLVVRDYKTGGAGKINSATLNFGINPAKPILSTSNLPIVIINTNGVEINNETKILSDMKIIYNGEGMYNTTDDTNFHFSGKIAIKIRGSSSQKFIKKQYGFDTMDEEGLDDVKVSILGMPKESDWVLSAIYQDKTLMRNPFTYQISREMGRYATRTHYCEVIINDEYKGVFVFQEKIKRDKNRVDVEKLSNTDLTEPNVTGGYIFEIDNVKDDDEYWYSSIPDTIALANAFVYTYPSKAIDLQPEKRNYIESYIHSFEESLLQTNFTDMTNGFRKYLDENSFIDYFIVTELSHNIDGYRKSAYFHKKREGKLFAGPVWDYDLAWGNANYYMGATPTGYRYSYNYPVNDLRIPFWWPRMMEDPVWKQNMVCRYRTLRSTILSEDYLFGIIDSLHSVVDEGQQRNFIRWDIMGKYVSANPSPIPADYVGEVNRLKTFISERLNFLDNNLGICGALNTTIFEFNAIKLEKSVQLDWEAVIDNQSDINFEIERSTDINSGVFNKIGQLEERNVISGKKYKFRYADLNPQSGNNVYRIKTIDKHGDINYSRSIPIQFVVSKWTMNPNEIRSTIVLQSPLRGNELIKLSIYKMNGQVKKSAFMKNNKIINYNVNNLSNGVYVLEIIDSKQNREVIKFIKK